MYNQQQMQVPPAQVQLSQFMQMQQGVAQAVMAGLFQTVMMSGGGAGQAAKTILHQHALQHLAQNNFQNPQWNQWCQMAIDFCEFQMCTQGQPGYNNPAQAVAIAVKQIYKGFLGMTFANNPQGYNGQFPQPMIQQLQESINMIGAIQQDLQAFRNRQQAPMGYNPTMGGGVMGGMQQAQSVMGGPQINMAMNNFSGTALQGAHHAPAPTSYVDYPDNADIPPPDVMVPVAEWTSGQSNTPQQGNAIMHSQQPAAPAVKFLDTTLPVPMDVTQIKVDPFYYIPTGYTPNKDRPFDLIYNPGGIEICPAHLVPDWRRTVGDEAPYTPAADPLKYCWFLVKFPDGTIKDTFVEWSPMLNYLNHEIDDELKRQAYRPNGVVKANAFVLANISKETVAAIPAAPMVDKTKLAQATNPVVVESAFVGCSDLENEVAAVKKVRELLELDADDIVPAHEYQSMCMHQLDISFDTMEELQKIATSGSLGLAAHELNALVAQGLLPARYFRFLDKRLTDTVNAFVRDSLSVKDCTIESFATDVVELMDVLAQHYSTELRDLLTNATPLILARGLTVERFSMDGDDRDDIFAIDHYTNFQLPWLLADICTQNIQREPVLLARQSNELIVEIVKGMWKRAKEANALGKRRMRLITADGIYLDVIRGYLVEGAILLKRA
jgi:hypothetical protein